jgi:hypothetical protein
MSRMAVPQTEQIYFITFGGHSKPMRRLRVLCFDY